jgi:hypothetical protein
MTITPAISKGRMLRALLIRDDAVMAHDSQLQRKVRAKFAMFSAVSFQEKLEKALPRCAAEQSIVSFPRFCFTPAPTLP